MLKPSIIGLDPSFTNLGTCFQAIDGSQQIHIKSDFDHWACFMQHNAPMIRGAIMEEPNLDTGVFKGYEAWEEGFLSNCKDIEAQKSELRKLLKIAQDIGKQKAAADQMRKVLDSLGIPYALVAPSARDRAEKTNSRYEIKIMKWPTKTTSDQYKWITEVPVVGRTNEHTRDAGTLLIGRTLSWIEAQHKIRLAQSLSQN